MQTSVTEEMWCAFLSTTKFEKNGQGMEWNGNTPAKKIGNLGTPREVVSKFQNSGTTRKPYSIGLFILGRNCCQY